MIPSAEFPTVRRSCQRAAAPVGGTRNWVRGCVLSTLLLSPMAAVAQDAVAPLDAELFEVLVDEVGGEPWVRFRYLAPQIARELGRVTYGDVEADMSALCNTVAIDYLDTYDLDAQVVSISLSDRKVPFGVADPDATQFIEVYRVNADRCIWEAF